MDVVDTSTAEDIVAEEEEDTSRESSSSSSSSASSSSSTSGTTREASTERRLTWSAAAEDADGADGGDDGETKSDASAPTSKRRSKGEGRPLVVCARIRPNPDTAAAVGQIQRADDGTVIGTAPERSQAFKNGSRECTFGFNKVFDEASTQGQVFDYMLKPIVDEMLAGHHGLLFAYGPTRAGKTFTVLGNKEHPGLVPLALQHIFATIGDTGGSAKMSYYEVYNDKIFDLSATQARGAKRRHLDLKRSREPGAEG